MMRLSIRLSLLASTALVYLRQVRFFATQQDPFIAVSHPGLDTPTQIQNKRLRVHTPILDAVDLEDEYILWHKNYTYFEECRNHFIRNRTWGKERSLLVDKIEVKKIVESLNIKGLGLPPTLAVLEEKDVQEYTSENMLAIPQPYIIKASHTSGGVARVEDDKYLCFKRCESKQRETKPRPFTGEGSKALELFREQSNADLARDFSKKHDEFQYRGLQPRIIIEKDIMVGEMKADVTFWYVSNGVPLFVSLQCGATKQGHVGTENERVFVSTAYNRLDMKLKRQACAELPPKPANWEDQVRIATELASAAPGVVRVDLYSGGDKVYFSEFTFTTNYCSRGVGFHPRVADGLLYAVAHDEVKPSQITPEFVEKTIGATSWALVSLKNEVHLVREESKPFPSPIDLCEKVGGASYNLPKFATTPRVQECLAKLEEVKDEPLRCVIKDNEDPERPLRALGVKKHPSVKSVMARVDWGRAIILLTIVCFLTYTGRCTEHERNQFLNNALYLAFMTVVIYTTTNVEGIWSGNSLFTIVGESYRAFVHVHPNESPLVAISHFGTYWFYIASWRCKSLRNLLFWQFMIELVTASVNEFTHHTEAQNDVRCMRIAFIGAFKSYAIDNILRVYICPPFFVFGYLLPKFTAYWIMVALGMSP